MENVVDANVEGKNRSNKRELTNSGRTAVLQALLQRSKGRILERGAIKDVASKFGIGRNTVGRIWSRALDSSSDTSVPMDSSSRKFLCGRKKKDYSSQLAKINTIPLRKRTTLKSTAEACGIPKTTLIARMKDGEIRTLSNERKGELPTSILISEELKNYTYLSRMYYMTNSGDSPKFTVSIEGNIGCGKSTLLNYFNKFEVTETIQEPIHQWTNVDGHNALANLYQDEQRWSFTFNMYALLTRMKLHTAPQTKPVRLLERSVYSTHHCFVKNGFQSGAMTGMEYAVLSQWFNWLVSDHDTHLNLIVYLKADPNICYERLKKRSRKEEETVPVTLLENLHKMYEDWLINQVHGPLPAPVMVLDANSSLEEMVQVYEAKKESILCGTL